MTLRDLSDVMANVLSPAPYRCTAAARITDAVTSTSIIGSVDLSLQLIGSDDTDNLLKLELVNRVICLVKLVEPNRI